VFKLRLKDGKIAANYMMYIDDSRPVGPSAEEFRQAHRNLSATCNHYRVQDATRKQMPPSLIPGAWKGVVLYMVNG
jgi:hypothetical protein